METAPSTPASDTDRKDEGSILILAVVLVLVFGVLAAAMASYGAASFRYQRVVRVQTALRTSADAGLRYGLESLRMHTSLCSDYAAVSTDLVVPVPFTTNDATVTLTCRYVSGNLPGANQWGIVLTGNGATAAKPSFMSTGATSAIKRVDGPIYMQVTSPANVAADLRGQVRLNEGDLYWHSPACTSSTTAPSITNLSFSPSPPRGYICTTTAWQSVAPMPTLPPKPLPIDPPGRDDLVPGCRIFFPGAYHSPPALARGDNYFVSGEYYFEFDGALEIKQADVQGGQPDPYSDDVRQISGLADDCANVLDNEEVAASETGYGATWVLAGGSKIDIGSQARLEMFSRIQTGGQNVSIQAVETAGAGYNLSTVTMADDPIVWMHPGNNNDMVIHGLIRTPNAQVAFGNVTNTVSAQATGGIVAAGIDMQGSASASGWLIGRSTRPAATKVELTSTATDSKGVSVTMRAVADYRLGRNVGDATTYKGSTVVVSNSARFTSKDVGSYIIATSLPVRTTIVSVLTASIVVVSAAATVDGTNTEVTIRTAEIALNSWRRV